MAAARQGKPCALSLQRGLRREFAPSKEGERLRWVGPSLHRRPPAVLSALLRGALRCNVTEETMDEQ